MLYLACSCPSLKRWDSLMTWHGYVWLLSPAILHIVLIRLLSLCWWQKLDTILAQFVIIIHLCLLGSIFLLRFFKLFSLIVFIFLNRILFQLLEVTGKISELSMFGAFFMLKKWGDVLHELFLRGSNLLLRLVEQKHISHQGESGQLLNQKKLGLWNRNKHHHENTNIQNLKMKITTATYTNIKNLCLFLFSFFNIIFDCIS